MKDLRTEAEELTTNLDGIYSQLERLTDSGIKTSPQQIQSNIDQMELLALRGWDIMDLAGHGDLYGQTIRTLNAYYDELLSRTTVERFIELSEMRGDNDTLVKRVMDMIRTKNARTTRLQRPNLEEIVTQFPPPYDSLSAVLFNHAELVLKISYAQRRDEANASLGLNGPTP